MARENSEAFREMMGEAFSISELKILTFDKFPELHAELHDRYDLSELVIKIFDHAKKKGLLNLIIDFTKIENPSKYEVFAPKLFFDGKSFNSREGLEDKFIDVDYESYNPKNYPEPYNLNGILQILEKHNLIVLHSNANVNWFQLLSHLAWQLNNRLSGSYKVKQLFSEARLDKTPLISLLRSTSQLEPTIFLSSTIRPEDVNYTLRNLQALSKEKGHFILIQTELRRQIWESRTDVKPNWFLSFKPKDLHPLGQRSKILADELQIDFDSYESRLTELAKYLSSFQSIIEFFWDPNFSRNKVLTYFSSDNDFFRLVKILEKRKSKSDIEIKRSLFNQLNGLPLQVLAIGMAFLNHVNKKDLIPFLDSIVFNPWRKRIPNLNAFDLGDLDKLHAFYEIRTSREINQEQIITDYKAIFKIAWATHRHFFISAGNVLYEMLKLNQFESLDSDLLNTLDHSSLSNEGLELIKISVQKYLTYLNFHEPNLIKGALIDFASSDLHELRNSAARIIAELQEIDEASDQEKTSRIYLGLNIFQQEKIIHAGSLNVDQNLDATSALIIAFAAKYNLLNQLDNKLAELFIDFIRQITLDRNPENVFRKTLRDEVIPIVISLHHGKFDNESLILEGGTELLEVAAVDDYFRYRVCEGLASAYLITAPMVESKLNRWRFGKLKWSEVESDFLKNLQMSLYLGTTARIAFNFFYEKDWYLIDGSEKKEWQTIRLKYKKLASYFDLSLQPEPSKFLSRYSLLKELQYIYLIFMTYEDNFFDSSEGKLDKSEWEFIFKLNSSHHKSWYNVLCLSTISRYLIQRANVDTGTTPIKILIDNYPNFPDFSFLRLQRRRFGAYEFVNGRQINFYIEVVDKKEDLENFRLTGIESELIHNIKRKNSNNVYPNIKFVLQMLLEIVHLIDFSVQEEINRSKDRRQDNHQFVLDFSKINSLVILKSRDIDWLKLMAIKLFYSIYEVRRNFSVNFDLEFYLNLAPYIENLRGDYPDEFDHLMNKLLFSANNEREELLQIFQSTNYHSIEYEFGVILKIIDECFKFSNSWNSTIDLCILLASLIFLAWLVLIYLL